jgi:hypothetical protein
LIRVNSDSAFQRVIGKEWIIGAALKQRQGCRSFPLTRLANLDKS